MVRFPSIIFLVLNAILVTMIVEILVLYVLVFWPSQVIFWNVHFSQGYLISLKSSFQSSVFEHTSVACSYTLLATPNSVLIL